MTLPEFTHQLATKLNAELNIPWIDEDEEQQYLEAGIGLIAMRIPVGLRKVIVDAADGLTEAEIELHKGVLAEELAKLIDNKRVPNWIERYGAELIIDAVLNFARKGQAI